MALADALSLDRLPPWALYGGLGLTAGGGYLLYRRRKAAAGSAAPAPAAAPVQAALDYGAQTQQPSIVPYYLTDQSQQQGSTTMTQRRPPKTVPASIPSATGAADLVAARDAIRGATLPAIPPPASPPPPAPSGAPMPAGPPQVSNLPSDVLAQIRANGENLIGNLIDPKTGGTWWFGDKGGVFAAGGARFLGSVPSVGALFPGFKGVQAIPIGTGYRIVNSQGQTYDFNG